MIEIINNDCLIALKAMPDNSVDSVVTDPPYGISFMGKKWDYDVPSVDIWKEVFRVLKPGGHVLCACGTRTQHRMTVNIEDAGFEIRDVVAWIYGCLSDDTEVLTRRGWVQYHKSKEISTFVDDEILIYDIQNDIYKWEKPERWNEYNIIKDTAYHIQSDYTDQIVSRNHRCLVEREGKLIFLQAEELSSVERMPTLPNDIPLLQERRTSLLQSGVQWILQRTGLEEVGQSRFGRIKSKSTPKRKQKREEPCVERWNNLPPKERVLCGCEDKVCCLSEGVYSDGTEGRVCDGVQACDGNSNRQTVIENRMRSSYRPQSTKQYNNQSDVICIKQGSQTLRSGKTYHTSLATVTPIEYSGIIFCPTVSTGAFVARRNGKVFLTGNSGFPKSLNIGKAFDKEQGNERTIIGTYDPRSNIDGANRQPNKRVNDINLTGGKNGDLVLSLGSSEYEGWGTALKPAMELWTLARKPLSERTVASNVLKWGTGGINIDGCRVDALDAQWSRIDRTMSSGLNNNAFVAESTYSKRIGQERENTQGRFPANVIHDGSDEVLCGFPITSSGTGAIRKNADGLFGLGGDGGVNIEYGDSGSASRFFYCAKASKSERNKGLDGFEKKDGGMRSETSGQHLTRRDGEDPDPVANYHPTVKPVALMRYLCRMITPKGGIVLDPFMGSGTTGIGAKVEGFSFIGIEREPDYCKIARARIDAWKEEVIVNEPTLF